MNYIDLAVIIIIALFTYLGYKKGFFVSLLELLRYIVGVPLCFSVSDKYSPVVYESYVRPKAVEMISEKVNSASSIEALSLEIQNELKELPSFLVDSIDLSSFDFNKSQLTKQIMESIFDPVLIPLTKCVVFICCFVAFFGITGIILSIFKHSRKKKSKKSGKKESSISKTDRIFGGIFGICKSFVTIIAISSILLYILDVSASKDTAFFAQIESSKLLPLIDSINPINLLIGG